MDRVCRIVIRMDNREVNIMNILSLLGTGLLWLVIGYLAISVVVFISTKLFLNYSWKESFQNGFGWILGLYWLILTLFSDHN